MKILIAVLLILHGLITVAFSAGSYKPGAPVANPGWLNWWPYGMGHSWLLPRSILESPPVALLLGTLFLGSGLALIAAGLGLLGWIIPPAWAAGLAALGAAGCLGLLLVYLHPFYLVAIGANLAMLACIYWLRWPDFLSLPS